MKNTGRPSLPHVQESVRGLKDWMLGPVVGGASHLSVRPVRGP